VSLPELDGTVRIFNVLHIILFTAYIFQYICRAANCHKSLQSSSWICSSEYEFIAKCRPSRGFRLGRVAPARVDDFCLAGSRHADWPWSIDRRRSMTGWPDSASWRHRLRHVTCVAASVSRWGHNEVTRPPRLTQRYTRLAYNMTNCLSVGHRPRLLQYGSALIQTIRLLCEMLKKRINAFQSSLACQ